MNMNEAELLFFIIVVKQKFNKVKWLQMFFFQANASIRVQGLNYFIITVSSG